MDDLAVRQHNEVKAAIVKRQTEDAAVEGAEMGEKAAMDDLAVRQHNEVKDMVKEDARDQTRAMEDATQQEIGEGISAPQRAVQAMRDESAAMLHHHAKEVEAEEADNDASAALERSDIAGSQDLKDHAIKQDAMAKAGYLHEKAARDINDAEETAREGVGAAVDNMAADTIAR